MAHINSKSIVRDFFVATVAGVTLGTLESDITAASTTITLAAGFTALEAGPRTIKIGDELIVVTGIGASLSVIPQGRGFFNSAAVEHLAGASVIRATFSDVIGQEVQSGRILNYKNEAPGVEYSFVGAWGPPVNGLDRPRVRFKFYGGKDSEGVIRDDAPEYLYGLFTERCDVTDSGAVSVNSGVVITSDYYDEEGQNVVDDSIKPVWPYILGHVDFELRTE